MLGKELGKTVRKTLCVTVVLALLFIAFAGTSLAARKYEGVTIRAMMEPHPTTTALIKLLPEFEEQTGMTVILEVPYEHLPSKALLNFVSQALTTTSSTTTGCSVLTPMQLLDTWNP